ncbi:hypothetical protein [Streptococcus pluranimalium]|uniref:hypothetical protein n=1 Tax=Streptococcus pluranimalium TaxID=82348 RepID=UPI003F693752
MTYTHLTTNELVMIEAYYQEGATVSAPLGLPPVGFVTYSIVLLGFLLSLKLN